MRAEFNAGERVSAKDGQTGVILHDEGKDYYRVRWGSGVETITHESKLAVAMSESLEAYQAMRTLRKKCPLCGALLLVDQEAANCICRGGGATAPPGHKEDSAKPRMDLIQHRALLRYAEVLGYGAAKYTKYDVCNCTHFGGEHDQKCNSRVVVSDGAHNWRKVDGLRRRYYAAALRHLFWWALGERLDPVDKGGSGLPHLAHAVCNVCFLLEAEEDALNGDAAMKKAMEE